MVASVAAGNTCGVAPDADLVVVKIDYFRFDEMVLAYAIDFVKKIAVERNLPYLISLSYLPKGGPKDGRTGVLSRIIQSELDANLGGGLLKAIVAAAGNENYDARSLCRDENNRMHVHRAGTGGFTMEISTTEKLYDDACVLELWYPVEYDYSVRLVSPEGTIYGPLQSDQPQLRSFGEDGLILLSNNRRGLERWGAIRVVLRDPDSLIAVTTDANSLRGGKWHVQMDGDSGVWHGYVSYINPSSITKAISKSDHTNEFKIRSAGNVGGVVTVGSINNGVVSWQNILGGTSDYTNCYNPYEISHFSSRGPTKAGLSKPDIYAPGAWVRVAVSQDIEVDLMDSEISRKSLADNPQYVMNEGTSFAAPQVTGTIALMVAADNDGTLTHDRIKYILNQTARRRGDGVDSYLCLDPKKALELSEKY